MELDRLHQIWQSHSLAESSKSVDKKFLLEAEKKVLTSKKKLLRTLWIEIAIGGFIYAGAGLTLFYNNATPVHILFAVKIILLSSLFAIPSILLLYKSIAALKSYDYGIPLKSFLEGRISSLKKSIRIYMRSGLLACFFIIIALLTDGFYLSQPLWLKITGVAYVLLFAALLSNLLQYYYGKEIKTLERQFQDMGDL